MSSIEQIGSSIRRLRKSQHITLLELSSQTSLSVGYLSNIERNVNNLTLVNLQKICEALNTSLGDLLERNAEEKVVIRGPEREKTFDEDQTIIETIEFGKDYGSYLYMTIEPDSKFDGTLWNHHYHEIGTMISGRLDMEIDGIMYHLEPGDTILVRAYSKHCCFNPSKTESSVSYWCRHWPEK